MADTAEKPLTLPTPQDVLDARERLRAHGLETTPTLACGPLQRAVEKQTGKSFKDLWVKLDTQMPTGSFKERGALNALLLLTDAERERGVVAASAGNHAQALARHAAGLGMDALIVMPEPTPTVKVRGTEKWGAKVVLSGNTFDQARQKALEIEAEEGRTLVHPFDDPHVVAGQGVAFLEMLEAAPHLEVCFIPIGGGGLIAGSLLAREALAAKTGREVEIVGVEPALYPCMHNALEGSAAPVEGGATLAEGIAVKTAGEITRRIIGEYLNARNILLVDEAALESAVVSYAMDQKLVVEGAGAAGLAALLAFPDDFEDRSVGLMACGGNIDARLLAQVCERHLVRTGRRVRIRLECSDRPGQLAELTRVLMRFDANVIEVSHQRLDLKTPAKQTVIEVFTELADPQVLKQLIDALRVAGFGNPRAIKTYQ